MNHGEISNQEISVELLLGEIDVEDDTNSIILPIELENITTSPNEQTFYEVRVFFVDVMDDFNILCMNADGWAYWDDEPEQYIMLRGTNQQARNVPPSYSEIIRPGFWVPSLSEIPGQPISYIYIDGFEAPSLQEEPRGAIAYISNLDDPWPPLDTAYIVNGNNPPMNGFRFHLFLEPGTESEITVTLTSDTLGWNDIEMDLIETDVYHHYTYDLLPPYDEVNGEHQVMAVIDCGGEPDQIITQNFYDIRVVEDDVHIPSHVSGLWEIYGFPIASIAQISIQNSTAYHPYLLISPGAICNQSYDPGGEFQNNDKVDRFWISPLYPDLGIFIDPDMGFDRNIPTVNGKNVYDVRQTTEFGGAVLLHDTVDEPPQDNAVLRIYTDFLFGLYVQKLLPPNCHAFDTADDYYYVVDPPNKRVNRYYFDGNDIVYSGPYWNVGDVIYDISIGPNGHIFAAVGDARKIYEVSWENDNVIVHNEWDMVLRNQQAHGICVDDEGYIYVADDYMSRIFVYYPDGDYCLSFGSPGGIEGRLTHPSDVEVDEDGFIYVSEIQHGGYDIYKSLGSARSGIQVFSPLHD